MDLNAVRRLLRAECKAAGGVRQFAARTGISHQHIYAVLIGTRAPGRLLLDALGLEMVPTYRRKPQP